MYKLFKLIHIVGLAMFAGSIATYVIVSSIIEGADLIEIAFGRTIITTATQLITMSGLWVVVITGLAMVILGGLSRKRFIWFKFVMGLVVILNAYLFVLPSADLATLIANQSVQAGELLPDYMGAYMDESIFGGVNLLLALSASAIAVWKVGYK